MFAHMFPDNFYLASDTESGYKSYCRNGSVTGNKVPNVTKCELKILPLNINTNFTLLCVFKQVIKVKQSSLLFYKCWIIIMAEHRMKNFIYLFSCKLIKRSKSILNASGLEAVSCKTLQFSRPLMNCLSLLRLTKITWCKAIHLKNSSSWEIELQIALSILHQIKKYTERELALRILLRQWHLQGFPRNF